MRTPDNFNEFSNVPRFKDKQLHSLVAQVIDLDLPIESDTSTPHITFNDFIQAAREGNLGKSEFRLGDPLNGDRRASKTRIMLQGELARRNAPKTPSQERDLMLRQALVQEIIDHIVEKSRTIPSYLTQEISTLKTAAFYYLLPQLALNVLDEAGGREGDFGDDGFDY